MIHAQWLPTPDEDVCLLFQLENQKGHWLCDCGFASALGVKECRDTLGLFVTHAHVDHFIHFGGVMRHQLAVGRKVIVCGPPGIAARVSAALNAFTWNLSFDEMAVWYEVREVEGPDAHSTYALRVPDWSPVLTGRHEGSNVIHDGDGFQARYALLDHGTPTVAYAFEEPASVKIAGFPHKPGPWVKAAKEAFERGDGDASLDIHGALTPAREVFQYIQRKRGHRLGFVMDHAGHDANHAQIAALLDGVDELFIECYYRHEDLALAVANHHSTARLSGLAARKARAAKATPCHFSRRYNAQVHELVAEFMEAYQGP